MLLLSNKIILMQLLQVLLVLLLSALWHYGVLVLPGLLLLMSSRGLRVFRLLMYALMAFLDLPERGTAVMASLFELDGVVDLDMRLLRASD